MRFARLWLIGGVLLVVLIALTYFWYSKSSAWEYQSHLATPAELQQLVEKVGKLVVLPPDEAPTVITVADPAQLAQWPLFHGSKRGDKVLVFEKSGKIILYDPVADRVVAAGVIVSQ